MSEHLLDRANSTPVGHPIEVFQEEAQAEQIDVLHIPRTLEETAAKFGRHVPAHHERALEMREPDSPPVPVEAPDRSMDVVLPRPYSLRRGLAMAAIGSTFGSLGANHINLDEKVRDAFSDAKTGIVAAEREAATDRKAKAIVVKSMNGNDGPVKVRVKQP